MGYVNASPEDDYQFTRTAQANPIEEFEALPWYSPAGLAGAIPRGLVGALDKTIDLTNDTIPPMAKYLGMDTIARDTQLAIPEGLKKWSEPDNRTQGPAAQIVQSVSEGLGLAGTGALIAGPIGAATMLGGVQGYAAYKDQKEAGVDTETAAEVGGLTGLANALGVFLPMSVAKGAVVGIMGRAMAAEAAGATAAARLLYGAGEVLAPAAGRLGPTIGIGVGTNLVTGMAQRGLTGEILRDAGYEKQAEQYRVFDAQSMVADIVLGAAFGGLSHLTSPDRVRPTDIDDAMAVKKQEHFDRSGPGIQTNPLAANAHVDALGQSIEDLAMGRTPNFTPEQADTLLRDVVPDPMTEMMVKVQREAVAETYNAGDLLDTPVRAEVEQRPAPVQTEAPRPVKLPEGERPAVQMHPMAQESMNQLVANNPDLEIVLGDGRAIKVVDLPAILEQNAKAAEQDSVLHEIAAACYIRTFQ